MKKYFFIVVLAAFFFSIDVHASKKISELDERTDPVSTDLVPIVDTDGSITYKSTLLNAKKGLDLTKADVGLANAENTSDANKPISTATQNALDALSSSLTSGLAGKQNTITAGTTSQYYRGDKSFQTLDKAAVGLSNVDNTADANKPVSSATQTALNAKADGAASSSDNQLCRFDGTTGKVLQTAPMSVTDGGLLSLTVTGSGFLNALDFINDVSVNPVVHWVPTSGDLGIFFKSGNTYVGRIQDNGAAYFGSLGTLNGMNIGDFYVRRGVGPGIEMGSIDYGVAVDEPTGAAFSEALFKVLSNSASNVAMRVQAAPSQTANLIEFKSSGGTTLSAINKDGLMSYTTSNSGYWQTSAPTTVKEALDRLAKQVSNNGGSPIP